MERRTWFALLGFIGLGVVAALLWLAPEKGETKGERPRPVPALRAADVVALDVAVAGKNPVSLQKKQTGWQLTSPIEKPADARVLDAVLNDLEKMQWSDIVSQKKIQHAELEVSDDKAIHVVAKKAGGQILADLYIGKLAARGVMVRVAGKDDVWQVAQLNRNLFQKETKEWRNRSVFNEKADDVEKTAILGEGATVVLERVLPDKKTQDSASATEGIYQAKWKVVDGGDKLPKTTALFQGKEVDAALINQLISGLSSLQTDDFVDDIQPEKMLALGFSAGDAAFTERDSAVVVKVFFKGGNTLAVRMIASSDGKLYAQSLGNPLVFVLSSSAINGLYHLPKDAFLPKTVVDLKAEALGQVTVQVGKERLQLKQVGKSWKAEGMADADESKLKSLTDAFEHVVGEAVVSSKDPGRGSLATSTEMVTLVPQKGPAVVLRMGSQRGNRRMVWRQGAADAWWVSSYIVDRMLKKPADVKKSSNQAPAGAPGMPSFAG